MFINVNLTILIIAEVSTGVEEEMSDMMVNKALYSQLVLLLDVCRCQKHTNAHHCITFRNVNACVCEIAYMVIIVPLVSMATVVNTINTAKLINVVNMFNMVNMPNVVRMPHKVNLAKNCKHGNNSKDGKHA